MQGVESVNQQPSFEHDQYYLSIIQRYLGSLVTHAGLDPAAATQVQSAAERGKDIPAVTVVVSELLPVPTKTEGKENSVFPRAEGELEPVKGYLYRRRVAPILEAAFGMPSKTQKAELSDDTVARLSELTFHLFRNSRSTYRLQLSVLPQLENHFWALMCDRDANVSTISQHLQRSHDLKNFISNMPAIVGGMIAGAGKTEGQVMAAIRNIDPDVSMQDVIDRIGLPGTFEPYPGLEALTRYPVNREETAAIQQEIRSRKNLALFFGKSPADPAVQDIDRWRKCGLAYVLANKFIPHLPKLTSAEYTERLTSILCAEPLNMQEGVPSWHSVRWLRRQFKQVSSEFREALFGYTISCKPPADHREDTQSIGEAFLQGLAPDFAAEERRRSQKGRPPLWNFSHTVDEILGPMSDSESQQEASRANEVLHALGVSEVEGVFSRGDMENLFEKLWELYTKHARGAIEPQRIEARQRSKERIHLWFLGYTSSEIARLTDYSSVIARRQEWLATLMRKGASEVQNTVACWLSSVHNQKKGQPQPDMATDQATNIDNQGPIQEDQPGISAAPNQLAQTHPELFKVLSYLLPDYPALAEQVIAEEHIGVLVKKLGAVYATLFRPENVHAASKAALPAFMHMQGYTTEIIARTLPHLGQTLPDIEAGITTSFERVVAKLQQHTPPPNAVEDLRQCMATIMSTQPISVEMPEPTTKVDEAAPDKPKPRTSPTLTQEQELAECIEAGVLAEAALTEGRMPSGQELTLQLRGELKLLVTKGQQAQETFIKMNLASVHYIIRRNFSHIAMDSDDIYQEGKIGLLKALYTFNHRLGHRFSTHSYKYIESEISRSIANNGRTIRLPVHIVEGLGTIRNVREKLQLTLHRPPTDEEVVAELSSQEATIGKVPVTLERLRKLDEARERVPFSFDRLVDSESDRTLGEVIGDYYNPDDDSATVLANKAEQDELAEAITEALDFVYGPPGKGQRKESVQQKAVRIRNRTIIPQIFGLEGYPVKTQPEIAEEYGMTPQTVSFLKLKFLKIFRERYPHLKRYY
ncbi:MAG TPA: sigma-70 family RNA polymerase sigma factor [Nevskiaceae bacterium]|nr:sigma-70 family RNA polymerase sigma factor [Nevskiaceae bacterium]